MSRRNGHHRGPRVREGQPERKVRCPDCGAELIVRRLSSGFTVACDAQPASVVNRLGLLVVGHRPHSKVCTRKHPEGETAP